jgi:hypothetical protein
MTPASFVRKDWLGVWRGEQAQHCLGDREAWASAVRALDF